MAAFDGPAVPGLLLLLLLGAAILTDSRHRRIPNKLILAGWSLALLWHALAAPGSWAFDPQAPGAVGAPRALLAGAVLLAAFLPFYALRIMGAGDVKLMSVVGMFFGASADAWAHLAGVSLFVLIAGGLLGLARICLGRTHSSVLASFGLLRASLTGRLLGLPSPTFDPRTDTADRMPYAVAIALGSFSYVVAKWAGWITRL